MVVDIDDEEPEANEHIEDDEDEADVDEFVYCLLYAKSN